MSDDYQNNMSGNGFRTARSLLICKFFGVIFTTIVTLLFLGIIGASSVATFWITLTMFTLSFWVNW